MDFSKSAELISEFLGLNEDLMPSSISKLASKDRKEKIIDKLKTAYNKPDRPKSPSTVPDHVVSMILEGFYGYPAERLEAMKKEHQDAMAAENIVGGLLERYLSEELMSQGWVWCCGETVKKIDFIKRGENGFVALQVKNRDNTENSSSSAIRTGTEIKKWFRTKSRTGQSNWENFPDEIAKFKISEVGFREFVTRRMIKAKGVVADDSDSLFS